MTDHYYQERERDIQEQGINENRNGAGPHSVLGMCELQRKEKGGGLMTTTLPGTRISTTAWINEARQLLEELIRGNKVTPAQRGKVLKFLDEGKAG